MPLTYRDATDADLPFIVGLIVEDTVVETDDSVADAMHADYRNALAAMTNDPHHRMIVAELDGVAVGCVQLTFLPGLMRRGMWRALVEVVHIADDRRGQGLGGEMMRWVIEESRRRGCGMVQLTSNKKRPDAHRFYERLGFAKSHEGFKLYL